jgi:hypothetical protein
MKAKKRKTRDATQRVNVDLPLELLAAIDADADRIGVTRQAWIKIRLADHLDRIRLRDYADCLALDVKK